ncbi:unnamed protein product [Phaeothamnion confervicola]
MGTPGVVVFGGAAMAVASGGSLPLKDVDLFFEDFRAAGWPADGAPAPTSMGEPDSAERQNFINFAVEKLLVQPLGRINVSFGLTNLSDALQRSGPRPPSLSSQPRLGVDLSPYRLVFLYLQTPADEPPYDSFTPVTANLASETPVVLELFAALSRLSVQRGFAKRTARLFCSFGGFIRAAVEAAAGSELLVQLFLRSSTYETANRDGSETFGAQLDCAVCVVDVLGALVKAVRLRQALFSNYKHSILDNTQLTAAAAEGDVLVAASPGRVFRDQRGLWEFAAHLRKSCPHCKAVLTVVPENIVSDLPTAMAVASAAVLRAPEGAAGAATATGSRFPAPVNESCLVPAAVAVAAPSPSEPSAPSPAGMKTRKRKRVVAAETAVAAARAAGDSTAAAPADGPPAARAADTAQRAEATRPPSAAIATYLAWRGAHRWGSFQSDCLKPLEACMVGHSDYTGRSGASRRFLRAGVELKPPAGAEEVPDDDRDADGAAPDQRGWEAWAFFAQLGKLLKWYAGDGLRFFGAYGRTSETTNAMASGSGQVQVTQSGAVGGALGLEVVSEHLKHGKAGRSVGIGGAGETAATEMRLLVAERLGGGDGCQRVRIDSAGGALGRATGLPAYDGILGATGLDRFGRSEQALRRAIAAGTGDAAQEREDDDGEGGSDGGGRGDGDDGDGGGGSSDGAGTGGCGDGSCGFDGGRGDPLSVGSNPGGGGMVTGAPRNPRLLLMFYYPGPAFWVHCNRAYAEHADDLGLGTEVLREAMGLGRGASEFYRFVDASKLQCRLARHYGRVCRQQAMAPATTMPALIPVFLLPGCLEDRPWLREMTAVNAAFRSSFRVEHHLGKFAASAKAAGLCGSDDSCNKVGPQAYGALLLGLLERQRDSVIEVRGDLPRHVPRGPNAFYYFRCHCRSKGACSCGKCSTCATTRPAMPAAAGGGDAGVSAKPEAAATMAEVPKTVTAESSAELAAGARACTAAAAGDAVMAAGGPAEEAVANAGGTCEGGDSTAAAAMELEFRCTRSAACVPSAAGNDDGVPLRAHDGSSCRCNCAGHCRGEDERRYCPCRHVEGATCSLPGICSCTCPTCGSSGGSGPGKAARKQVAARCHHCEGPLSGLAAGPLHCSLECYVADTPAEILEKRRCRVEGCRGIAPVNGTGGKSCADCFATAQYHLKRARTGRPVAAGGRRRGTSRWAALAARLAKAGQLQTAGADGVRLCVVDGCSGEAPVGDKTGGRLCGKCYWQGRSAKKGGDKSDEEIISFVTLVAKLRAESRGVTVAVGASEAARGGGAGTAAGGPEEDEVEPEEEEEDPIDEEAAAALTKKEVLVERALAERAAQQLAAAADAGDSHVETAAAESEVFAAAPPQDGEDAAAIAARADSSAAAAFDPEDATEDSDVEISPWTVADCAEQARRDADRHADAVAEEQTAGQESVARYRNWQQRCSAADELAAPQLNEVFRAQEAVHWARAGLERVSGSVLVGNGAEAARKAARRALAISEAELRAAFARWTDRRRATLLFSVSPQGEPAL